MLLAVGINKIQNETSKTQLKTDKAKVTITGWDPSAFPHQSFPELPGKYLQIIKTCSWQITYLINRGFIELIQVNWGKKCLQVTAQCE